MKFLFVLMLSIFLQAFLYAQDPLKVACIGNSITEGPGREHPDSYPMQLQELLGDTYSVKNFGVSGRTLLREGDFPYWDEPQFDEVKAFAPDILIIMLGTNDSKPQNWKHSAAFRGDYLDMLAEFKQHMPADGKVYVVMPVPVTRDNFGITAGVMNNEQRMMIMDIARSSASELIDLYSPLMNHPELLPDGVHPNVEGLGIMAQEIARAIRL